MALPLPPHSLRFTLTVSVSVSHLIWLSWLSVESLCWWFFHTFIRRGCDNTRTYHRTRLEYSVFNIIIWDYVKFIRSNCLSFCSVKLSTEQIELIMPGSLTPSLSLSINLSFAQHLHRFAINKFVLKRERQQRRILIWFNKAIYNGFILSLRVWLFWVDHFQSPLPLESKEHRIIPAQ